MHTVGVGIGPEIRIFNLHTLLGTLLDLLGLRLCRRGGLSLLGSGGSILASLLAGGCIGVILQQSFVSLGSRNTNLLKFGC